MTVFFDVVDEVKSITKIISSAFYFFNAVPRKILGFFNCHLHVWHVMF